MGATRLLKNEVSMKIIAALLGYESEAAWRKAFKCAIGMPRRRIEGLAKGSMDRVGACANSLWSNTAGELT